MKRSIKRIAGTVIATAILVGGAAACSDDGSVDVLQYGDYNSSHVFVPYSQPIVVHVTRKVYLSDSREYSSPTVERTYIHTHTCRTTTSRVNGRTTTVRQCN